MGIDIWHKLIELRAEELLNNGDYHFAAIYFLSIHQIKKAIQIYQSAHYYKEAITLANLRLSPDDPVIKSIYLSWAKFHQSNFCFDLAARCYSSVHLPISALSSLLLFKPNSNLHLLSLDLIRSLLHNNIKNINNNNNNNNNNNDNDDDNNNKSENNVNSDTVDRNVGKKEDLKGDVGEIYLYEEEKSKENFNSLYNSSIKDILNHFQRSNNNNDNNNNINITLNEEEKLKEKLSIEKLKLLKRKIKLELGYEYKNEFLYFEAEKIFKKSKKFFIHLIPLISFKSFEYLLQYRYCNDEEKKEEIGKEIHLIVADFKRSRAAALFHSPPSSSSHPILLRLFFLK